jgi:hypothetical protein
MTVEFKQTFQGMENNVSGHIIHLVIKDELSLGDYVNIVIPNIKSRIAQHDRVSFLVEAINLRSWDRKELWGATKEGFRDSDIMQRLVRIAVAGDRIWERAMVWLCSMFLPIRYFDISAIEEAKSWIGGQKQ